MASITIHGAPVRQGVVPSGLGLPARVSVFWVGGSMCVQVEMLTDELY
jgi:hypothetical protein